MTATVVAAMAQMERRLIGQRTKDALAVKRAEGVQLGRPREMSKETVDRIGELYQSGLTVAAIARKLNEEASRLHVEDAGIRQESNGRCRGFARENADYSEPGVSGFTRCKRSESSPLAWSVPPKRRISAQTSGDIPGSLSSLVRAFLRAPAVQAASRCPRCSPSSVRSRISGGAYSTGDPERRVPPSQIGGSAATIIPGDRPRVPSHTPTSWPEVTLPGAKITRVSEDVASSGQCCWNRVTAGRCSRRRDQRPRRSGPDARPSLISVMLA